MLWLFGIKFGIFPVLVCCTEKNLATLLLRGGAFPSEEDLKLKGVQIFLGWSKVARFVMQCTKNEEN
jgi:hypothetical protein